MPAGCSDPDRSGPLIMQPRSVLVAAETWFGSTTFGISQGFRRLGWEVYEANTREWIPQYSSRLLRAARRLLTPLAARDYNTALRTRIDQLKPTALVTIKGLYLERATLEHAARAGVKTLNYYPDVQFQHGGLDLSTFASYDRIFTTKPFHIGWLSRAIGRDTVAYLPHGYSPDVHRPLIDTSVEQSVDVVYIGVYTPYKERWLGALQAAAPEISIAIYGDLWLENVGTRSLRSCVRGHGVFGEAYRRAIADARICLAIHAGPCEPSGWEDCVSTRTFEIPACGGFMLHIDNEEARALFTQGEEFDVFANEAEMIARVLHYLPRPDLRQQMASRAHARAVPAYSYDARVAVMSQWIETAAAA